MVTLKLDVLIANEKLGDDGEDFSESADRSKSIVYKPLNITDHPEIRNQEENKIDSDE